MSTTLRYISGKPKPTARSSASTSHPRAPPPPPPPLAAPANEDRRIGEYSSTDDVCPVCKSDRYLHPQLRLMVSWCYHKMCESCMDRIFSLGPEPCPVCHVIIRKAQFRPQIFENLAVQKEVAIRKRTSKIFNKRQEDFQDLKSYNDYLETFEDLTFNLINNTDVAATEIKIKQYEAENRALIDANLSRGEREAELVRLRDEDERARKEEARNAYEQMDEEERAAREEERRAVLEGLESSTASTTSILSAARTSALKRSTARASEPSLSSSSARFASLRFFSHLADDLSPSDAEEAEDPLADMGRYDAYEGMYEIRARDVGYGPRAGGRGVERDERDEGGWRVEEGWEKAVRSAVAGLFLSPVGWEVEGPLAGGQVVEGGLGGHDVVMVG